VSDIFNEVDEEVRREKLKQLWDRYSIVIIAVALLIVVGVAGWRGYQWNENRKAAEAGAAFEAADALVEQGKHQEAEAAYAKVAAEGTSGYRLLAKFREAAEVARRDKPAAVKLYDEIGKMPSIGALQADLAQVRAGMLLVDTAPLPELSARLEPLTARDRPFRHTARELLALASYRAGDAAAAKRWYEMITADTETPEATRSRVEVLMALSADAKS
jgi:hypothetical protein